MGDQFILNQQTTMSWFKMQILSHIHSQRCVGIRMARTIASKIKCPLHGQAGA